MPEEAIIKTKRNAENSEKNMQTNARKIVAWLIIVSGLLAIVLTVNHSGEFFTAKTDFPQVFKQAEKQVAGNPQPENPAAENPEMAEILLKAEMQRSMNEAVASAFPSDSISKLLNMISWSTFAFLLVYAGTQIAGIGIKLLSVKDQ